jgi:hypothetical protein
MDASFGSRIGMITCLLGILLGEAGCNRKTVPKKLNAERLEQYGSLPGLRASHYSKLTDELARLESEQATPQQLSPSPSVAGKASPKTTDLGLAMNEIVSPKQVQLTLQRIDKLYPRDAFTLSPIGLQNLLETRDPFAEALEEYRKLLSKPEMQFRVDLMQGLLADLSFVEQAKFVHRLEAISAAESLANGTPAEAVFPLRNMLSVDSRLGRLPHVVPRMTAASLRGEAIQILEAIAQHPQATLQIQLELYNLIGEQLKEWPDDAAAWIGDRAQGMHTYELIRDGYLTSIMSRSELKQLEEDRQFTAFLRAASQSIDEDQLYYLKTMRRIIQQCEEPYFKRKQSLLQVGTELKELEETSQYPIIAARFLLPDINQGHRLQAADRARCEGWALALAAATGNPRPAFDVNPLTGEPYAEQESPTHITIGNIDTLNPTLVARVPRLKKEKASFSLSDE